MSEKKQIILVGGGGHCKSCIDIIETEQRFKIAGIVDVKEHLHQKVLDYEVIASDDDLPLLIREYKYFLITVGHIKSAEKRREKFKYLRQLGGIFPTIISPLAYVSKFASVGKGTIIMHGVIVNAEARIGDNCIINSKALIEHDVIIGDHCHISTGSIVNGACSVGDRTFLGSNSVMKDNTSIAQNTIIGAGSVIVKSLVEPGIYVGNPARRIRYTLYKEVCEK